MQCEICHRSASSRLPFNCTICAREALYQPRIRLAESLLQNKGLEKEVEQSTSAPPPSPRKSRASTSNKGQVSSPAWQVQRMKAEQTNSEERTGTTLDHIGMLQEEIKQMKSDISVRKAGQLRRRAELASAKAELSKSQTVAPEPADKSIKRTAHRGDILHSKTAEARLFLCREAAQLYHLEQHKSRKGSSEKDVYTIGGVPIPDLMELNHASPTQVSASATNLAHLVHLASHYLSVKLPAEITLPHLNYPLPTMLSPSSSYTSRNLSFPGTTPSHSSHSSPWASRHTDHKILPRPRPLHLDKNLSVLAKDDQIAYDSVVEATTFLAWDIAWLCKTQGLDVGGASWEEVCPMGKNLWQLLFTPPQRSPISREASSKLSLQKPPLSHTPPSKSQPGTIEDMKGPPPLGHFSHGTTYGFLASAVGNEYMNGWRLQNPIKVIEKVKAMLLAERTGAEWELLEGNEWEDEEAEAQASGAQQGGQAFGVGQTGVLVRNTEGLEGVEGEGTGEKEDEREKGQNGWMKVKSR